MEKFSKKDTNIVKGLAIILMVMHHLFYTTTLYQSYHVTNFILPFSITIKIGEIGKVCVSIFVFFTGFGIARKLEDNAELTDREIFRISKQRYLKLELNFLFVYIWVLVTSLIFRDVSSIYGAFNTPKAWINIIIDSLGLANLFGTPTLNQTWWYMSLAILYLFITPVLIKIYKKYGVLLCIICSLTPYALSIEQISFFKYLGVLTLGIWCANENILEKMKKGIFHNNVLATVYLKSAGCILLSVLLCCIILSMEFDGIIFMLLAFVIVYFSFEFLADIKGIRTILEFLGKHSMNIFLVHSMIFYYYFREFIYSWKYAIIILLLTLLISCLTSILMEGIKRLIRYDKLINEVCNRVC